MRFFLDSADFVEIEKAWQLGVVSGVTTNPSLVAKAGQDFHSLIARVCKLVDPGVPVNAEVLALDAQAMVEEGLALAAIHPNVVVKISMTVAGLQAVKALDQQGIRTNVTLVFTAVQALLAAEAGATYVSPFLGRLDDISEEGIGALTGICEVFTIHDIPCHVIAASIRHPVHVLQAAKAGADIATIPLKILLQLYEHPLTKVGIEKFTLDWNQRSS